MNLSKCSNSSNNKSNKSMSCNLEGRVVIENKATLIEL